MIQYAQICELNLGLGLLMNCRPSAIIFRRDGGFYRDLINMQVTTCSCRLVSIVGVKPIYQTEKWQLNYLSLPKAHLVIPEFPAVTTKRVL
jgi:hypothetical protein